MVVVTKSAPGSAVQWQSIWEGAPGCGLSLERTASSLHSVQESRCPGEKGTLLLHSFVADMRGERLEMRSSGTWLRNDRGLTCKLETTATFIRRSAPWFAAYSKCIGGG
jgi:hypothetical protein